MFLEIEMDFNDPLGEYVHLLPDNEHCGKHVLDPSSPVFYGTEARSWEKLKEMWNKIVAQITVVMVKYNKR